jgi:DNA-binding SARP family transcriptional activator/LysM repeat protein
VTRLGRLVKGLWSLSLLLALVAGIPWALSHFIGWPLPHQLPTPGQIGHAIDQEGIADRTLIDALAVVVWITWAVLVVSIIVEIPAALAGRQARRLPLTGVFQPLTGRLVAAVLVAVLAFAPRPGHSGTPGSLGGGLSAAGARSPISALVASDAAGARASGRNSVSRDMAGQGTGQGAVLIDAIEPLPTSTAPTAAGVVSSAPASESSANAPPTYVVQRGDTLWAIAEQQLGDPLRWSEIYQLNEGRPQPDGAALTDPHWIDPGWTLVLPPLSTPVETITSPPPPSIEPPAETLPTTPLPAPPADPPAPPNPTTDPAPATSGAPARASASPRNGATRGSTMAASIRLPSGSIIAGSFAAGVLSALAAQRLRRRHRYRPQPPRPGRHLEPRPQSAGIVGLLARVQSNRNDEDEELHQGVRSEPAPMTVFPHPDALIRPDLIEVGSRSDEVVRLGLCDWPGLAISGPGATTALRAWLAALFTSNGPYGVDALVVDPLGERLFPGLNLPGLRRVGSLETGLSQLEAATIERNQRFDAAGVADAVVHRRASPEYPLPLLLVVTDLVPGSLDSRWRAMLDQGTRLGLGALVLAPEHADVESSTAPAQIVVSDDGVPQQVTPQSLARLLEGSVLFGLDTGDGLDLLEPVARIHNEQGCSDTDQLDRSLNGNFEGIVGAVDDAGSVSVRESEALDEVSWPSLEYPETELAPIRFGLFGPALVEAWGEKVSSGLRSSAYELLAWYALRPEGASAETAIEALWPDVPAKRGRERFWTALGNLRSRLHGPGPDGIEILTKVGGYYQPDSSVLDIDLWRFETALTDAANTQDEDSVIGALERAGAAYGGEFCPGVDALWVEPAREDLRRRALDVHIRLAELHAEVGRFDAAVAVLERTIELDSICEDAYRRLIALQAQLGRHDAAQRTWRLLQGRLAELDLEPEESTVDLVHDILTSKSTRPRVRTQPQAR